MAFGLASKSRSPAPFSPVAAAVVEVATPAMPKSRPVRPLRNRGTSALTTIIALAVGLVPILAVILASRVAEIRISDATRDAIDVLEAPVYVGFVSNLGIIVWTVAATACLFGGALLARKSADSPDVSFLIATGLLTAIAAADDAFLLHERLINPIAGSDGGAYAVFWAVLLIVYSAVAGRSLLHHRSFRIVVVAAFFLVSVCIDVFAPFTDSWTFVEDSAKYLGIVFWASYVVPLSYRLVADLDTPP